MAKRRFKFGYKKVVRVYCRIMDKIHKPPYMEPHVAGMFDQSWDWPTLQMCHPAIYKALMKIKAIAKQFKPPETEPAPTA